MVFGIYIKNRNNYMKQFQMYVFILNEVKTEIVKAVRGKY